jgi:hypothetical protein
VVSGTCEIQTSIFIKMSGNKPCIQGPQDTKRVDF